MKLAFCLYKYFPFGGLQRDFLNIATQCYQRGHSIRVYALSWQGKIPTFMDLRLVPVKALQHYVLYKRFHHWIQDDLKKNPVDKVIGFNKMPGLDLYYAADPCFIAQSKQPLSWYRRLNPRFQQFYRDEEAVFQVKANTHILALSETQQGEFQRYYHTPASRFSILPPGINRDRIRPENAETINRDLRREFSIPKEDTMLLMIGSGFKTKGVDRSIAALASLPSDILKRCHLIVIGQDKAQPFLRLGRRFKIADRLHILPGREDIPRFLFAADLLLHPAYRENAGIVLLEALVAGLPILVSDVCGYAPYIQEAGCGALIPSPFSQKDFNALLLQAIQDKNQRQRWQTAALSYAKRADFFHLTECAVAVIEGN